MKKYLMLASVLPVVICICALAGCNQREIKETTTEASTRIYTSPARESSELTETDAMTVENYYEAPYRGMAESMVEYTYLGKADIVNSCPDFDSVDAKDRWRHYMWKKNGKTIYAVSIGYYDYETDRTVSGYVRAIYDGRVTASQASTTRHTTSQPYYRASTARRTTQKNDPYDANDYAHPDDFYYDHYDDFWDYEDAEDYYYEHDD